MKALFPRKKTMESLLSAQQLSKEIDNANWVVMDCRHSLMDKEAGRRSYLQGHIPGARYIDMEVDLSIEHIVGETGRHPLPDRKTWQEKLVSWGLQPSHKVVVYDDAGGSSAVRLWWMLRWAGHENVALLDGGLQAWQESGQMCEEGDITHASAVDGSVNNYLELPPLTRLVIAEDVLHSENVLVDARDEVRFIGETEMIDPVAGHIPGAICRPILGNLDENRRFKSKEELQERFSKLKKERNVVCYCGSGVTACHNILAITLAGFEEPALYAGSWSEWITDSQRPIKTGHE